MVISGGHKTSVLMCLSMSCFMTFTFFTFFVLYRYSFQRIYFSLPTHTHTHILRFCAVWSWPTRLQDMLRITFWLCNSPLRMFGKYFTVHLMSNLRWAHNFWSDRKCGESKQIEMAALASRQTCGVWSTHTHTCIEIRAHA